MRMRSRWLLVIVLLIYLCHTYSLLLRSEVRSRSVDRSPSFGGTLVRTRRTTNTISLPAIAENVHKNNEVIFETNGKVDINNVHMNELNETNATLPNVRNNKNVQTTKAQTNKSKRRLRKNNKQSTPIMRKRWVAWNATNPVVSFFENIRRPWTSSASMRTNGAARTWWWPWHRRSKSTAPTSSRNSSPSRSQMEPRRPFLRLDLSPFLQFFQRFVHRNVTSITFAPSPFDALLLNDNASATPNATTLISTAHSWDSPDNTYDQPVGDRWAISAKSVDLSGKWKPIVTAQFKKEYDEYLENCGQSFAFRTLCLNFVGTTREVIHHDGNVLNIRGTNPVGVWERTLVASGSDLHNADYIPINVTFLDPDNDKVFVEAWWQNDGNVHKSWPRGKRRVRGGEFESTRYLENGGGDDVLVCESTFHPYNARGGKGAFRPAYVKWRFEREE